MGRKAQLGADHGPLSPGSVHQQPSPGPGLSGFVARAVEHELERDVLGDYLDELDTEFGPIEASLIEEIDSLWP